MKILILGASGMLGNAVFRLLSASPGLEVYATTRSLSVARHFRPELSASLIGGVDVENMDSLAAAMARSKPDIVVNCIGLVKQLADANDPLQALPINSLLPHRLARLCEIANARLVHVSTDCVFSGSQGGYVESDPADAQDLYGRSKLLGEVDYPHCITLRTSIIGHELLSSHGLVSWFLSQQSAVKGYTRAIFSGLPTCELARIIRDFVFPRPDLHGIYHVSADAISKFDLLELVNRQYDKNLHIQRDDQLEINRSLNSDRFRAATGYSPPTWPQLIAQMHAFK